jgi:hypothetical protein
LGGGEGGGGVGGKGGSGGRGEKWPKPCMHIWIIKKILFIMYNNVTYKKKVLVILSNLIVLEIAESSVLTS